MIFSGDLADKVLAGTKTQTRRPRRLSTGLNETVCRYNVGQSYAIQRKRGTPGLGPRIRILSVRRELVSHITEEDALAEGFASRAGFLERWASFYGTSEPTCWRIEFELAPETVGGAASSGGDA